MAIGDDAQAAGMELVPQSGALGSPGKVRQGPQEFNRTRDYIAQFFTAAKTYAASSSPRSGVSVEAAPARRTCTLSRTRPQRVA